MSVRISGGSLKNRVLKVPKGQTTRPTGAKVREAVFSILGSIEGLRVLDLYAGTGALGIEAISRGAHSAVFVERDSVAAQCIRTNLKALALDGSTRLLQLTVDAALRRLAAEPAFDLVFADPPWAESERARESLAALANLLGETARVVYEHARAETPTIRGLTVYDRRIWGDTAVTFFRLPGQSEGHTRNGQQPSL